MKVLMVNTWHHRRGGDATYTLSLSDRLHAAGHQVVPLAMRHPDNDPSVWEARFVPWVEVGAARSLSDRARMLRSAIWSRTARRVAADLIAEARPDIAHLQHVHRHLTPSVLDALDAAGVPAVWTVHDHELICPAGHLFTHGAPCERCRGHNYHQAVLHRCKRNALLPSLFVALEKEVHRRRGLWERVERFLCPSAFLAEVLVRFGVPADRVQHLPNFLDTSQVEPAAGPGTGWLYAGRLTEEKGIRIALRAAARMPEHPFVVCGTGALEDELRATYARHDHIEFRGHLPKTALEDSIRAASVVVVPSLWYENFPYAVLEAQTLQRAVVASRIGGIPEQVDDGTDGVLFPPGDDKALEAAVRPLLDNPDKAQQLGAAGRQRVTRTLQPEDHLNKVLSVYQDVLLSTSAMAG